MDPTEAPHEIGAASQESTQTSQERLEIAEIAESVDLHDIATLVNYERASTEPRFRHAKLVEAAFVASQVPSPFTWRDNKGSIIPQRRDVPKRLFLLERVEGDDEERDLPTNIIPAGSTSLHSSVSSSKESDAESIYWEIRGNEGGSKSLRIFQYLSELFPESQPLHIRSADGADYTTIMSPIARLIIHFRLQNPRQVTVSRFANGPAYICGDERSMTHTTMAWKDAHDTFDASNVVVLDLASMQFGPVGRGSGGEFFRMEKFDPFERGLKTSICSSYTMEFDQGPVGGTAVTEEEEAWLRDVARRVKARWDARETQRWCGQCGAPLPATPLRCPCKGAYYCNVAHQKAARKYHKHFCTAGKKGQRASGVA